jgi:DNA-binding transcriptional regulator LsrR (DeoR family)
MRPKASQFHLVAVAYLSANQKTQDQIAADLGISQSLVSRLMREAKKTGILEVKTRFASERVSAEERARVEAKLRTEPLRQISSKIHALAPGKPIPTFHVYPCHSRNTSPVAWRHRIQEFSNDCADDLLKVLVSASVIGVAWGEMVANAVGAMQRVQQERRERRPSDQTIIPLLGEPLGRNITQYSSSILASKLAETLNPKPAQTPDPKSEPRSTLSLAPVPAFIPEGMTRAEINAIRKFIGKIGAYGEIYGADERGSRGEDKSLLWIDRVDTILTSISREEQPLGFDDDRLIHAAGIRRDRLNGLVIGDLCGVVIPRPNLDSQSKKEIKNIMARWTGIKVNHLEACAMRANKGAAGVIVLAIGSNKASVVYEALRRGLIQHLFMDEDLADRLGEICTASPHEF